MMKNEEKTFLLEVARLAAARSKGVRLKVGAVVSDSLGNMVASGYNGSVRGGDNCLEYKVYPDYNSMLAIDITDYPFYDDEGRCYKLVSKSNVIHAEQNVIAHAARRGISICGGTMFVTHSPCSHCTALMIQCGIFEVIFLEEYRLHKDVVEEYGSYIKFTKWNNNENTSIL